MSRFERPPGFPRYALALLCLGACGSEDRPGGHEVETQPAPDRAQPASEVNDDGPPPEVQEAKSVDWPMANFDYDNTRAVVDSPINSANVAQLEEAWRVPLNGPIAPFGRVTSNPLVLGDTVYLQSMNSRVYALDRATGQERWRHTRDAITVGPNGVAVGWGRVFANDGDLGVIALDAGNGRELWRFRPELVRSEGIDIQPLVYGRSVFVSTVPASLRGSYLGGSRGLLTVLDAVDGHVRWSFDTVDSADAWGNAELNGGGGAWYPPLIDARRGLSYWGTGNPLPWPNGASRPGPNLYTSSLVAVDLQTGELEWYHQEQPHDLFDWDFQNPPVRVGPESGADGRERIIGSGKTGTVVALDPDDGELLWRAVVGKHDNDDVTELPAEGITVLPGVLGGVLTPLAYAEGVVYVPVVDLATHFTEDFFPGLSDGTGALVALDVRDGSELWSVTLQAPCYGAATVVNDLVWTSDARGRVYAFARQDGTEVYRYEAPAGINAPLAVAGDLVLVPVGIGQAG